MTYDLHRSVNDAPRRTREKLDAATAEKLTRSGFGRGQLMNAAAHGDTVARDALRAYRDAQSNGVDQ